MRDDYVRPTEIGLIHTGSINFVPGEFRPNLNIAVLICSPELGVGVFEIIGLQKRCIGVPLVKRHVAGIRKLNGGASSTINIKPLNQGIDVILNGDQLMPRRHQRAAIQIELAVGIGIRRLIERERRQIERAVRHLERCSVIDSERADFSSDITLDACCTALDIERFDCHIGIALEGRRTRFNRDGIDIKNGIAIVAANRKRTRSSRRDITLRHRQRLCRELKLISFRGRRNVQRAAIRNRDIASRHLALRSSEASSPLFLAANR